LSVIGIGFPANFASAGRIECVHVGRAAVHEQMNDPAWPSPGTAASSGRAARRHRRAPPPIGLCCSSSEVSASRTHAHPAARRHLSACSEYDRSFIDNSLQSTKANSLVSNSTWA
jgi:hypothetical protein